MQAIIFANGEFVPPPDLAKRLVTTDLVMAADGGSQHCLALDLRPHVLIGDLDSLESRSRADWEAQGVRVIAHPVEKDQTDLELALVHAKEAGAKHITVLGGLGKCWDHSLANLLLLGLPLFKDLEIVFLHGEQRIFVINGIQRLQADLGDHVSLLPLGGDVHGVTTRGMKYPLNSETLVFGSSRGVSNVVLSEGSEVQVESGILLCVISPSSERKGDL